MVGSQLPFPWSVPVCLVPDSCSVLPVLAPFWHADGTARVLVALVLVVFWSRRGTARVGVVTQLVTRPAWLLDWTAAGIAEPRTSRPNTHRGGPWNTWAWIEAATIRLTVIWVPTRIAAKMAQTMKNRRRWPCRCSQRSIHMARSWHKRPGYVSVLSGRFEPLTPSMRTVGTVLVVVCWPSVGGVLRVGRDLRRRGGLLYLAAVLRRSPSLDSPTPPPNPIRRQNQGSGGFCQEAAEPIPEGRRRRS
jgi:hypothetical protein